VARKTFADTLKEARLAAGLSQAALARRANLTGSYISVLESRRRPPPSPRVVKALCKAMGIKDRTLLEAAALERSPPTVRRRLERMRSERGKIHKARDRLLTTTLFHVAQRPRAIDPLGGYLGLPEDQQAVLTMLLGRFRAVRSVREAEAQSEELLEGTTPALRDELMSTLPEVLSSEDETPTTVEPLPFVRIPVLRIPGMSDVSDEHVVLDARLGRDVSYAWRAVGDDGYPRVEPGDLLLIARVSDPEDGDLVLLREATHLRLGYYSLVDEEVRIAFPRPDVPPLRIPERTFHLEGVVRGVIRELE